jgi:hypothetical protein
MAGWKLRKDKTQGEKPAEPETAAEPATADGGAEIYSAPAVGQEAPAAEWGAQWQTPAEGGPVTAGEHAPDREAGGLRFEDEDGPLKMMDYSAPFTEDLLPLSAASDAPIIAAPPPVETPPAEMPTLATPSFDTSAAEPEEAGGDFTSTLRMSREELAAAFAPPPPAGVPPVAPFVLDTPLVSPATEETPPRLVVRMGRLSAAFDLTKEVTVIGRPDSEMHYYPDVEIDLDDAVSRRHAEIIRRGDTYSLVDTGSTNGTLLNGETLPPHEERVLAHGDRIRVGERTEIIFE